MKTRLGFSVLKPIFLFLLFVSLLAVSEASAPEKVDKGRILEAYGKLPLYFIENKGQLDPRVRFYVKTSGQVLYFTDAGIVFDLLRRDEAAGKGTDGAGKGRQSAEVKTERLVFSLVFKNARKGVLIAGIDGQEAGINYFVGNDRSKWKRDIPTYKGVVYKGVYKGIDLKVFGNGKDIEYEFIVNPGGNADDILLTYNGIKGLSTNGEGELLITTGFGELKETRPYIYQEIEGERVVAGSFEIRHPAGRSQTREFSYGFQVAAYNPSYPLIIDPTLSYSTYLGGYYADLGQGIAVDGSGGAYITGVTHSDDFPTQNPYQGTNAGISDVFITKFSSSGSALSYSTYLGGSAQDYGTGIAVDGSGNAYVTGYTFSGDFPTQNPYQGANAGIFDAFITKLSSSGSALSFSTYLGGSGGEIGRGIAVDGSGNAYVTGDTFSSNFPTQNPYQGTFAGIKDAFITKLSSSGSALSFSTYLGGSSEDIGNGIAVDGSGNAYVVGDTWSSNFPTRDPYQEANAGGGDAFIAKFSSSGSALSYSTYLGGSSSDEGRGIAVDGSGGAYVTGSTDSIDFPTQNPYQGSNAGISDVFIAKFSSSGSALSYSTYLGGSSDEHGNGIAVDGHGNAYVTGNTASSDFPTQDPYQEANAGEGDAFITKLASSGSTITYSTYLGGSDEDGGTGIAIDGSGYAYVTGWTGSEDFPTQNPHQGSNAGFDDAFVAKLSETTSLDGGYDLGFNLWVKAVLKPTWMDFVTLRWHKGGESVSPAGDTTIWGYFYADPNDFPYGATDNPEVFVKAYITKDGWANIAFNHVTVDDVDVFSAHDYGGTPDQQGLIRLANRLEEHAYNEVNNSATEIAVGQDEGIDEIQNVINSLPIHRASSMAEANQDNGYDLGYNLWLKAVLKPDWMDDVTLRWQKGGESVSQAGDTTIWGYFYADPSDFPYGSADNPEVFVKAYIAKSGWANIAFNHVTVDDVDVFSAHDYAGTPDQVGEVTLTNRLEEHEYSGVQ